MTNINRSKEGVTHEDVNSEMSFLSKGQFLDNC